MSDTHELPQTDSNSAEHHRLMTDNARLVFSELDADKRMAALEKIWAVDGTLIEKDAVASGYEAISAGIGALLAQLPPGTVFAPDGDVAGHHGVGRLRWRGTSADGVPGPVSGTDIAFIHEGRIARLYVILDPKATDWKS